MSPETNEKPPHAKNASRRRWADSDALQGPKPGLPPFAERRQAGQAPVCPAPGAGKKAGRDTAQQLNLGIYLVPERSSASQNNDPSKLHFPIDAGNTKATKTASPACRVCISLHMCRAVLAWRRQQRLAYAASQAHAYSKPTTLRLFKVARVTRKLLGTQTHTHPQRKGGHAI